MSPSEPATPSLSAPPPSGHSLQEAEKGHSLWQDAWHRLRKNRMAVLGGVFILIMGLASLIGPAMVTHGYQEQNLELRESPPSSEHWLGTDKLGRDLLARVLYGGRISLTVGLVATAVSLTIGVLYGTLAGFCGGKVDAVMMRLVDILYALPFTIFVILLMVFFGRDIRLMFLAIGAVEWLTMARIVRGRASACVNKNSSRPASPWACRCIASSCAISPPTCWVR